MLTRKIYMAMSDKLTEFVNSDRQPNYEVLNGTIIEHEGYLKKVHYGKNRKVFHLSRKSKEKLSHTHPYIRKVVNRAIKISKVDFAVFEGMRTYEKQRRYVKNGVSKTMDSYHLYGLAVDLVAYVDGKLTWDTSHYDEIRIAVHLAMRQIDEEDGTRPSLINGEEEWGWDHAHWQVKPCTFTKYQNPKHYFKKHKFKGFA